MSETRYTLRIGTRVVALEGSEITIGRDTDCAIVLADEHASRRHARILVTDRAVEIEDLGSANGVLVDGVAITSRTPISHGTVIGIGQIRLVLLETSQRGRATAALAPARKDGGRTTPGKLAPAQRASPLPDEPRRPTPRLPDRGGVLGSPTALVLAARRALVERRLPLLRDAVAKIESLFAPGAVNDAAVLDEALQVFTSGALVLTESEDGAEWVDRIFEAHARTGRVLGAAATISLERLARALGCDGRSCALYLNAMSTRARPLTAEETARTRRLDALLRELER